MNAPTNEFLVISVNPLIDYFSLVSDSSVYTPRDGDSWILAKLNVQVTDYGYNQIVEHLLKVHLLMEPFCVVLKRHMSDVHPLHQILKFHCRGITVTNTLGSPNLLLPYKFTHQLLAFGDKGSNQLVVTGYKETGWKDTDFMANIKVLFKRHLGIFLGVLGNFDQLMLRILILKHSRINM